MGTVEVANADSWKTFFDTTKVSIGVETAMPWIRMDSRVSRHIAVLLKGILFSLARMGARITPRDVSLGQEFEPRDLGEDAFLFSHHSVGRGEFISRFKHTYRLGYFTFDPIGYAGLSRFANSPDSLAPAWELPVDEARSYLAALRREYLVDNVSKFPQPEFTPDAPEPGYLFVPMQLIEDTVMRAASGDPLEFYLRVVTEAGRLGRQLVLKRHPSCWNPKVEAFLSEIGSLDHVTISSGSINQLVPGAERVVMINSTVGLEALIHGRPVLSYGASEYAPLTTQIKTIDEVGEALAAPAHLDEVRVAQFVQFFFEHFCVRSDDGAGILRKVQEAMSGLPRLYGWEVVGT